MGAYRLPRGACQPCSLIDGCFAINLCHDLLWAGLAVPISSEGGTLDVPDLDVRIGHGRAGIPAAAGVFELTVRPHFQHLVDYFKSTGRRSRTLRTAFKRRRHAGNSVQTGAPEHGLGQPLETKPVCRQRGAGCQPAESRFILAFWRSVNPPVAQPRPGSRKFVLDIVPDSLRLSAITYPVVVRFFLPKSRARPIKHPATSSG